MLFVYIVLYLIALIFLLITFLKDKTKAKKALFEYKKTLINLMPSIIVLILIIGIITALINPEAIVKHITPDSGVLGVLYSLVFGMFLFIPSYIAIPISSMLNERGAGIAQVSTLVASLMGIGIVYIPLEIKYFRKKFVIIHLITSISMAIIVGLIFIVIGVVV